MNTFLPPPRYHMDTEGRDTRIMRTGFQRAIAYCNPYNGLAVQECQRMTDAANKAGEYETCVKWLVAAITTAQHQGMELPRVMLQARDRGMKALEP